MNRQNLEFNLKQLNLVAQALDNLLEDVTFVGGAVTALLVAEVAQSGVRRTEDVDVIIDVISRANYYTFCEALRERGFKEDNSGQSIICRWLTPTAPHSVKVDIMPTDPNILGFTNRWYKGAIASANYVVLPSGVKIRVVSAPYFLATKLEAFKSRGGGDYFSHDLEDIIFVMENRESLIKELMDCDPGLKSYLSSEIKSLVNDEFLNILPGLLENPDAATSLENTLNIISRW